MPHRFPVRHADRLLSPERRRWQDPEEILDWLRPREGETIIDLGCGPGFLSLPAARRLGPAGRVLALDISRVMLRRVAAEAAAAGLNNVLPVRIGGVRLPFESQVADHALIVNVLHELPRPEATLRSVSSALRPGGRLLVVEWRDDQSEPGPPAEGRISSARILAAAMAGGFSPAGEPHTTVHHRAHLLRRD